MRRISSLYSLARTQRGVRREFFVLVLLACWMVFTDVWATIPPPSPPPPVTNPRPTPPSVTANAGPDQTVTGGSLVQLSGTTGAGISVSWSQVAGPTVALSSLSSSAPTFQAPATSSSTQTLTFRYTASRNWSWCRRYAPIGGGCADTVHETETASDTVDVVVPPPPLIAEAGPAQTVDSGTLGTLSGSAKGGEGTRSYAWTQTEGLPMVLLSGADQASASFTAPLVTARTTLTFKLTVTAGSEISTDTVQVTVAGPEVVSVAFTSRPAAGNTYRLGERIRSRVAFDRIMTVSGSPVLALEIGTQTRSMTHIGLTRSRVLDFEYQVQASDLDTDGISVGENALSVLADTSITDHFGRPAMLSLSGHEIVNQAARKVDGSQSSTLPTGGTLPACTMTTPVL